MSAPLVYKISLKYLIEKIKKRYDVDYAIMYLIKNVWLGG
jgi:hypothetical protein